MVLCTIREMKQLDQLRQKLNLESECFQPGEEGKIHFVVGYCQGLFNPETNSPKEHTEHVTRFLQDLHAPLPQSHELFIGLKPERMFIKEYIKEAISPLAKDGRVPVIITQYDPAKDLDAITEIFNTTYLPIEDRHTILVRVQLGSEHSIQPTAKIIHSLYNESVQSEKMPRYWPLIQADRFSSKDWKTFQSAIGKEISPYVTIAATPFTTQEILKQIKDNVGVYQFFIGRAKGVHNDGEIELNERTCVGRENNVGKYNVLEYAHSLKENGLEAQVGIVCGQSQGWEQRENIERVKNYIPLLKQAGKILWQREI